MPCKIRMTVGDLVLSGELNDSETAAKIADALPLESQVNTWGQEIYFSIGVEAEQAPDARSEMSPGELAFWPMGNALCLFWGPTPASKGDEPRAYSPVNPVGRVQCEDFSALDRIQPGQTIRVERAE